ncbi:MAG: DUF192 domain-containing protein [Candidatus Aenigmarchaeota archaeon]|nr:DUF192 domain-containing protein [Candidatus Aenigmarchaeota archaeon]
MINKETIKIFAEVADDQESRSQGLMFRRHLGKNSGMLFSFDGEDYRSFWMKNTHIPLDIAFISKSGTIVDIRQMYPLSSRSVVSSKPVKYALEMNKDWFSENGINSGFSFREKVVLAQSAGAKNVVITHDFKTAVDIACERHWDILIKYSFKTVEFRNQKAIRRDGEKPSLNDYHLLFNGSVKLGSGKIYEYNDAGNGEYIVASCLGSSGDARCFFVDGIIEFNYFYNGRVFHDPREIDPVGKKLPRKKLPKEDWVGGGNVHEDSIQF